MPSLDALFACTGACLPVEQGHCNCLLLLLLPKSCSSCKGSVARKVPNSACVMFGRAQYAGWLRAIVLASHSAAAPPSSSGVQGHLDCGGRPHSSQRWRGRGFRCVAWGAAGGMKGIAGRLQLHPVSFCGPALQKRTNCRKPYCQPASPAGAADLVCYGRHYIANPDLPRRFRLGAPLNK